MNLRLYSTRVGPFCATFRTVSTDTTRRAVPRRQLRFLSQTHGRIAYTVVRATSYTHGEWENWGFVGTPKAETPEPLPISTVVCDCDASALSPHMPKFKMIALFGASGHVGEISLSDGFQFSFL